MISLVLLAIASTTLAQTSLIANGDFENAATLCGPLVGSCVSSNAGPISPWVVAANSYQVYEAASAVAWPPFSGAISMDLNSDNLNGVAPSNGQYAITITQTVATTVNTAYRITFELNESPCGPSVKTGVISVNAANTAPLPFSHSNLISNFNYVQITYQFVASSASTIVTIGSTTANSTCGPVIDLVQMFPLSTAAVSPVALFPAQTVVITSIPASQTASSATSSSSSSISSSTPSSSSSGSSSSTSTTPTGSSTGTTSSATSTGTVSSAISTATGSSVTSTGTGSLATTSGSPLMTTTTSSTSAPTNPSGTYSANGQNPAATTDCTGSNNAAPTLPSGRYAGSSSGPGNSGPASGPGYSMAGPAPSGPGYSTNAGPSTGYSTNAGPGAGPTPGIVSSADSYSVLALLAVALVL